MRMQPKSESHAREMAKQAKRKAALKGDLEDALDGVDRIVFEAGCGHGHWLTHYAEAHPGQTCVGIDLISQRIRKACAKRDKRGLGNLHFFKCELGEFLEVLPSHLRFDLTVLLFPDPWPKARHHRRRMVQRGLLDVVAERTVAGDRFCFRSDDRTYYDWTIELLDAHPSWEIDPAANWPFESDTWFQGLMDEYFSVVARRVRISKTTRTAVFGTPARAVASKAVLKAGVRGVLLASRLCQGVPGGAGCG